MIYCARFCGKDGIAKRPRRFSGFKLRPPGIFAVYNKSSGKRPGVFLRILSLRPR